MSDNVLLVFLVSLAAVSSQSCQLADVEECNQYSHISPFKFRAFIPRDQWKEKCATMRIVLDCIYQPKYMDGCTPDETLGFDTQRDVSDAVCYDDTYMKHVDCLGNAEIENKLKDDCMTMLTSGSVTCEIIKSVRSCVTSTTLSICGQDDSNYVDFLIHTFLSRYASTITCQLEEPKFQVVVTKPTSPNPSTTRASDKTQTPTNTTGTTTIRTTTNTNTNTTPGGAGSILKASSSLLAFMVVVKLVAVLISNTIFL